MAPQKTMFGDIVQPSVNVGTRRWYTVPLSIAIHAAAIFVLIVIPLMAYDVLPTPYSAMDSFRTVTLPPPPLPPPPRAASKPVVATVNPDLAPVVAPPTIAPEPPDLGFDRVLDSCHASRSSRGRRSAADTPTPDDSVTGDPPARSRWRRDQAACENEGRISGLPADCGDLQGPRGGHHRSHDRCGRRCPGGEGTSLDPASRLGGARCGEAVGVHPDTAQWRAGAGHHDRHRAVHAGTMNVEKLRRL